MAQYLMSVSNVVPVVGNDALTFQANSGRRLRLEAVRAHCLGSAAGVVEIRVARSTGGVGGAGGGVSLALDPESGTGQEQYWTTWGTQPTVDANDTLLLFPLSTDGGDYSWEAPPSGFDDDGGDISARPGFGQISFRVVSISNTGNVSITAVVEDS